MIGDKLTIDYLATMEDERVSQNLESELTKINGVLDKKIVPKSISQKVWVYSIQTNGKIVLVLEKERTLFKDPNPNIKDDF